LRAVKPPKIIQRRVSICGYINLAVLKRAGFAAGATNSCENPPFGSQMSGARGQILTRTKLHT
jgi:hypothetical protein